MILRRPSNGHYRTTWRSQSIMMRLSRYMIATVWTRPPTSRLPSIFFFSSSKSFWYFQTMSARRQSSATSLSKFARTTPVSKSRSNDFCNSFWGVGDGGVEILFARMRGAARTMEELKNFWKERLDHSCRSFTLSCWLYAMQGFNWGGLFKTACQARQNDIRTWWNWVCHRIFPFHAIGGM